MRIPEGFRCRRLASDRGRDILLRLKKAVQRWQLDRLFRFDAYTIFGDGLVAVWVIALIQICTLQQFWEDILLGLTPTKPLFGPGWHPEEAVYATDWLADFRPNRATELGATDDADFVPVRAEQAPILLFPETEASSY
ncbi:MAG: hypothetical protein AAF657_06325 [Acidobacteriota bacterium]